MVENNPKLEPDTLYMIIRKSCELEAHNLTQLSNCTEAELWSESSIRRTLSLAHSEWFTRQVYWTESCSKIEHN